MSEALALEADFWRLFGRVLGRKVESGHYCRRELPEWDSLRHVEMIFEIEETFGVAVPQEAIAELFSDTDTVLKFIHANSAACR